MLQEKKLFEIPVYKISEREYYKKMTNYIVENNPDDNSHFGQYLRKNLEVSGSIMK